MRSQAVSRVRAEGRGNCLYMRRLLMVVEVDVKKVGSRRKCRLSYDDVCGSLKWIPDRASRKWLLAGSEKVPIDF